MYVTRFGGFVPTAVFWRSFGDESGLVDYVGILRAGDEAEIRKKVTWSLKKQI
jgi:hypothetical protein